MPIALIGQLARLVEQLSPPFHLVEPPFSLVHTSVLVVESSLPVPHSLLFVPLVLAALLVPFHHILRLIRSAQPGGLRGEEGDSVSIDLGRRGFLSDYHRAGRERVGELLLLGIPSRNARGESGLHVGVKVRGVVAVVGSVALRKPFLLGDHYQVLIDPRGCSVGRVGEDAPEWPRYVDVTGSDAGIARLNWLGRRWKIWMWGWGSGSCHEGWGWIVGGVVFGSVEMRMPLGVGILRDGGCLRLDEFGGGIANFWCFFVCNLFLGKANKVISLGFLLLDHPLLQLNPIRPFLLILDQHHFDQSSQVLRVDLLESVDVVLHCFPVDAGGVVAVALILILRQTCLEDDQSQGEDIAFVGVDASIMTRLLLQRFCKFGRQIDVRGRPACAEGLVV